MCENSYTVCQYFIRCREHYQREVGKCIFLCWHGNLRIKKKDDRFVGCMASFHSSVRGKLWGEEGATMRTFLGSLPELECHSESLSHRQGYGLGLLGETDVSRGWKIPSRTSATGRREPSSWHKQEATANTGGFVLRYLRRGRRNQWITWPVVCATGRIRGLLATTKLVGGRKKREWLRHSENLQGCENAKKKNHKLFDFLLLTSHVLVCMNKSQSIAAVNGFSECFPCS